MIKGASVSSTEAIRPQQLTAGTRKRGVGYYIRKLGPINLDFPSASDVTPMEERVY